MNSDFVAPAGCLANFADNGQLSIFRQLVDAQDGTAYQLPPAPDHLHVTLPEALDDGALVASQIPLSSAEMPHVMTLAPGGVGLQSPPPIRSFDGVESPADEIYDRNESDHDPRHPLLSRCTSHRCVELGGLRRYGFGRVRCLATPATPSRWRNRAGLPIIRYRRQAQPLRRAGIHH